MKTNNKNLFNIAACFTDLHVGLKQNSKIHNDDCVRFVDWFIEQAKSRNAETCIFLGDWSHHRNSINVASLNVSINLLKKLNNAFEKVYFITGNHDLYYRDKRELNSIEYARDLSNFVIIDEHFIQDNVAILPWLVGEEYKKVAKYNVKYIFGHMELPHFKMNALVEMPDRPNSLKAETLTKPEYVFTGHFHKRQIKNNIHYIGNAFPHNYADVNDDERGAMFLRWDEKPEYVNWEHGPTYRIFSLSEILDNHSALFDQYTHAKINIDIPISYEESLAIKEQISSKYNVRELKFIQMKDDIESTDIENINFESIDQIVMEQLKTIESENINKTTLIDIYQSLDI